MSEQHTAKKIPILAYALIGAAGLGMLFLDNPFSHSGHLNDAVAEVNGQEIGRRQLDAMISDLRVRTGAETADAELRQSALDSLISRTLLQQHALSGGYRLSDQALYQYIKGEFGDEAAYQQMLDHNRITAQAYQESIRQGQSVENYYRIMSLAGAGTAENQALIDQLRLAREVHSLRIPIAPFAEKIVVDEAALAQYFQDHQHNYLSPPWVNLSYVLLSPAALSDAAQISEEQLAAAREARAQNAVRGGKYLIFDQADDAAEAAAAIAGGNRGFEELAAAIDKGEIAGQAGDLNPNAKGKGISKEVDEALFAIEEIGGISPVFHTEYGAMLVQLGSIEGGEAVEDAVLRREIAAALAQERFSELANRLFDAAQSGAPLDELAAQAGVSVQQLQRVSPGSSQADWLALPQAQALLFGDKAATADSPVQALDAGDASVFVKIDARGEAAPQPLAAVRSQVEQDYRTQAAQSAQQAAAQRIIDAFKGDAAALGNALAQAKDEAGAEEQRFSQLSYLSPPAAQTDPLLYSLLMEQSTPVASHELPDHSIVVARIDAIAPLPEAKIDAQLREMLRQQEQLAQVSAMHGGLEQWLRAQSKIRVDNAALNADPAAE